ncbi:hypothetical protein HDU67_004015, partial [Dinochytrium kinnereticum]
LKLVSSSWVVAVAALTTVVSATQDECAPYTDLSGASAITYSTEPVWFGGRLACLAAAGPAANDRIRANPIVFLEYATGESAGDPIVTALPCQPSYSDAWLRFTVVVPEDTAYNYYRDYAQIDGSDLDFKRAGFFNYPIVAPGSKLSDISNHSLPIPDTFSAWFGGQKVYLFDFGAIPQSNTLDHVKTTKAVAVFQQDEFSVPIKNGFSVIDSVPGDEGYTGFYDYKSVTTESLPFNTYRNSSGLPATKERNLFLNCPVVHVESSVYVGNPPVPAPSSARSPVEPIPEPEAPSARLTESCENAYLNASGPGVSYFSAVGWSGNKKFGCWNLGLRSTGGEKTAFVQRVFQPVYTDSGKRAGLPIFTTLPCQPGYSDAAEVTSFPVPPEVPFNFFKNAETFMIAELSGSSIGKFNYPIVEPRSTISINPADSAPAAAYFNQPRLSEGWFNGRTIYYVDFGPIPARNPNDPTIATSEAVFPFTKNQLGDNVLFGNPVFSDVAGDATYSGFYRSVNAPLFSSFLYRVSMCESNVASLYDSVGKIPSTTLNEFTDYMQVDPLKVSELNSVLNCPTAYYT